MKLNTRFVARVALFSALAYVSALISFYIPNVSFIFIVIFTAGILLRLTGGLMVGGIGMFLWTVFNPLGMAEVPVTMAQIAGMMIVGALGAIIAKSPVLKKIVPGGWLLLGLMGLFTGLVFQLAVSITLSLLYGPFWPMLISNMGFALLTIGSNIVIFVFSYPLLVKIVNRENKY